MTTHENEATPSIKRTYQRYIVIDENIHAKLSLAALSLYMAFRYKADYSQEDSKIKCTAKTLYTAAKISRAQFYRVLNELEEEGLVMRSKDNVLGEACVFHIAKELGYFTKKDDHLGGVSNIHTPVQDMDTYISNSFHNTTTSESCTPEQVRSIQSSEKIAAAKPPKPKPKKPEELMKELIEVYREVFPDNPQPHARLISTTLKKTLQTLIKRWPEADPDKNPLTKEAFRLYMESLREMAPKFSLGEYVTQDGTKKKNNMETFCRWNTFVKFLEGAYS